MTDINCNQNNIKLILNCFKSDTLLSHNSDDISPGTISGYPAIVREVTLSQWEQQNRQEKVKENYPVIIPATGLKPCEESQNVIGASRCNDCKTIELKIDHCESWNCPICGMRKVRRQAKNIVNRLNGFKTAIGTTANPRHIVVSSHRWDNMTLEQITKNVNNLFQRYLKELSGVYVIHMFRIRGWDNVKAAGSLTKFQSADNIKRRLREYREMAGKNKDNICPSDFWSMIKKDVLGLGGWREYIYVSPHIHIIGWGYLPNSKRLYEETGGVSGGFIYKTKEKEGRSFDFYQSSGSFDFTSDILKTLYYLGGHGAIISLDNERHANRIFRAFGFCSVHKLKQTLMQDYKNDREIKRVLENGHIMIEKHCPTCDSLNCVDTKIRDKHNYCKAYGFDENYNPLDCEGNIIKELILPIHKFEWRWYHYQFVGYDVREKALKFAERLPHKTVIPDNFNSGFSNIGRLERLVLFNLKDFDKWKENNTNNSLGVVDDV